MSIGFKLLLVPQLVKTEIFKHFEQCEIATLSLCSKRSYFLAKLHRKKTKEDKLYVSHEDSKYDVKYDTENGLQLGVTKSRVCVMSVLDISKKPMNAIKAEINGFEIPAAMNSDGILNTFWKDTILGMKTVMEYVLGLYNMNVFGIICNKERLWMLNYVNSRQDSLNSVQIHMQGHALTKEQYRDILVNCMPTDRLSIYVPAPKKFRYTGAFFPKPTFLSITQSQWVTLENLKSMNSKDIMLVHSTLKNSEINSFLKHWLAAGSPHLRTLWIVSESINFNQVILGLEHDLVHVPEERVFTIRDTVNTLIRDSYDIRRNDGVLASVEVINNYSFSLFVWPSQK